MGFTQAGRGPLSLNSATAPPEALGTLVSLEDATYGTRSFRLLLSAASITNGMFLHPVTASWNVDITTANADDSLASYGAAIGTATSAYYFYGQVSGLHTAMKIASTDISAAIGKRLYPTKNVATGLWAIATAAGSAAAEGQYGGNIGFVPVNGANPATAVACIICNGAK